MRPYNLRYGSTVCYYARIPRARPFSRARDALFIGEVTEEITAPGARFRVAILRAGDCVVTESLTLIIGRYDTDFEIASSGCYYTAFYSDWDRDTLDLISPAVGTCVDLHTHRVVPTTAIHCEPHIIRKRDIVINKQFTQFFFYARNFSPFCRSSTVRPTCVEMSCLIRQ